MSQTLLIDTRAGIAGDIMLAALIGLGADEQRMMRAMERAGNHLGRTRVRVVRGAAISLVIRIQADYEHLHESQAKQLAAATLTELQLAEPYCRPALRALDALCAAERYVHSADARLGHMRGHVHAAAAHSRQACAGEATLHEAKDILIDVVGLAQGLQELAITRVCYLDYVGVGSGEVCFSHGTFSVPAPATAWILSRHAFTWRHSAPAMETATPTGVSMLAGCHAGRVVSMAEVTVRRHCLAQGTRALPPVRCYLAEIGASGGEP